MDIFNVTGLDLHVTWLVNVAINAAMYSLINFSKFFRPGHSYSNSSAIAFWKKFHPTQAFKINVLFV